MKISESKVGYYRDSYNPWNLLWQFGLGYWEDITNKYSTASVMSNDQAKALLNDLKSREPLFEKNMKKLREKRNLIWDYRRYPKKHGIAGLSQPLKVPALEPDKELNRKGAEKYYRKHYRDLKKFLNTAIILNSDIECSM
jgi:hypothetical protein